MDMYESEQHRRFREAWTAVGIARPVHFSLFTFGESSLPYYLVCGEPDARTPVSVTRGEIRIQRPVIVTPETARPEFRDFFDNVEEEDAAQILLSRTAHFSNLRFANHKEAKHSVEGNMDGAVAKLNCQLDAEDDDRVAILTAPPKLAGMAVLRYAAEHVIRSSPGNIQELRERGFLA